LAESESESVLDELLVEDGEDDEIGTELAVSVMVTLKGLGAYLRNRRQSTSNATLKMNDLNGFTPIEGNG